GEEVVDGNRRLKVICRYWSLTKENARPTLLLLWLAADRNYLCVKSQTILNLGGKEHRFRESKVEDLHEVVPGLWLPSRVSATRFKVDPQRAGQPVGECEETLTLNKAVFNPARPVEFFRDVEIPDDIPVFEIENGRLAGRPFRDAP